MVRFFDTIDACWNIRNLSGSRDEFSPQLKQDFLLALAQLMSRYSDFWNDKPRDEFYCGEKFIKRLKGYKIPNWRSDELQMDRKQGFLESLRQRLRLAPIFDEPLNEAAE